jgi:nucleotide-binding universal stress UspA family protein
MQTMEQLSTRKGIALQRILIATDFSTASHRALDFAIGIARHYGSRLFIMHAVPPDPHDRIPVDHFPRELDRQGLEAENQLAQLEEDEPRLDEISHKLVLRRGNVWDVLDEDIERENIDLLVLGTRGRTGLKKLALGSVAEEVLRQARCPVLTVGPKVVPAASGVVDFKRILFPTDFAPVCDVAFSYALSLAEDYRSKLLLLYMVPPMPAANLGPTAYGPSSYAADEFTGLQRAMRENGLKKLKELIPLNARLAENPEFFTGTDFLPEGILGTAAQKEAQLIVMGANRTSVPRVAAHIPWALIHEIICHAACPVLTVCR